MALLVSCATAWGRTYRHVSDYALRPDSADVALNEQHHFKRALFETVGMNLSLWAVDRYLLKGQYAYISFKTIAENFRHGFEWDNDHLSTNMFAHPYNGSIYYNAGRSNGFNYWQSTLFAIGGSAMWELFMEREYPSTNDIIATPIGGAAIGEVFYRASDLLVDDRTGGMDRVGREIGIFIIDPMRGFNRLISGRSWRRSTTSGRHFGIPPIKIEVGIGPRVLMFHDEDMQAKFGATAIIDVEYGDRYESRSHKPYDYFKVLVELDAIKTQPILNRFEIKGRLLSRDIIDTETTDLSVGMYQHFDYFDSDTITLKNPRNKLDPCVVPYKLGTPASAGVGLLYRNLAIPEVSIEGYAHLNAVALAGILSDYYRYYHRNYNWASGGSLKLGFTVDMPSRRWKVEWANKFYTLYTWNGWRRDVDYTIPPAERPMNIQGDKSLAFFNYMETRVSYNLKEHLWLTLGADWYSRTTHYKDITVHPFPDGDPYAGVTVGQPTVHSTQATLYLTATYSF